MVVCGLFEESCGYCSLPVGTPCMPEPQYEELVFNNIQACGEFCVTCLPPPPPPPTYTESKNNVETLEENQTFVVKHVGELDMEAAPNPFTNEIRLKFNQDINLISSMQIVDMTGKEIVIRKDVRVYGSSILVDTNDLPSGVYFCKVLVNNQMLTKKIIKL